MKINPSWVSDKFVATGVVIMGRQSMGVKNYVSYDYEETMQPPCWHIYELDNAPGRVKIPAFTLMYIEGDRDDEALHAHVKAICDAMNNAIRSVDPHAQPIRPK